MDEDDIILALHDQLKLIKESPDELHDMTPDDAFAAGFEFCLVYYSHLKKNGMINKNGE